MSRGEAYPEEDIKAVSKNILELLNKRTSSVKNIFGSDDEEDDDQTLTAGFLEQDEQAPKKPGQSKRTHVFKEDEDEDDEVYVDEYASSFSAQKSKLASEEDEALVFSDGFDDDLMGDEKDRERLAAMTEIERENVLFERDLARQKKRERWELRQKLKMGKLKKPKWSQNTEIIDHEEDEDEAVESPPKLPEPISDRNRAPVVVDDTVELENILPIVLTRSQIEKWLYRSFFKTDIVGFFVRLSLGFDPGRGEQVYRLCQIDSVLEFYKTYTVNASITKYAFNLRIGKTVKRFTIDAISNSPPTQKEFGRWLIEHRNTNAYIMRRREANALLERLKHLEELPITEKEIDHIVKEKRKLNILKRNPAAEKAFLVKERELASQAGRADEVERIDASLAILNQKLSEGNSHFRADPLASHFEKNRKINQAIAEADLERRKIKDTSGDDSLNPFARKRTVSSFASIVSSSTYVGDKEPEKKTTSMETSQFSDNGGVTSRTVASSTTEDAPKEAVTLDDLEIDIPGIWVWFILDFVKSKARCSSEKPQSTAPNDPLAFLDAFEKRKGLC